jgi:hypothetical protein
MDEGFSPCQSIGPHSALVTTSFRNLFSSCGRLCTGGRRWFQPPHNANQTRVGFSLGGNGGSKRRFVQKPTPLVPTSQQVGLITKMGAPRPDFRTWDSDEGLLRRQQKRCHQFLPGCLFVPRLPVHRIFLPGHRMVYLETTRTPATMKRASLAGIHGSLA